MAVNAYTITPYQNSFTRSANTTPYVANTVLSGGSVVQLPIPDRPFFLRRLQISTNVLNASHTIRVHFFAADPTGGSFVAADAGTLNFAGLFNTYEGFLDVATFGINGITTGDVATNLNYVLPNTSTGLLYLLCETRTAFTPVASTIYRIKAYTEAAN